jgi:hypothetical protein
MSYGTIKVDGIQDSNGATLNILEVTTNESTGSTKGYMSAADKTKLDTLSTQIDDTVQSTSTSTVAGTNGISGAEVNQSISDYGDTYFYFSPTNTQSTAETAFLSDLIAAAQAATAQNPVALTITIDEDGNGVNTYIYSIQGYDGGDFGPTTINTARAGNSEQLYDVVSMSIPGANTYDVSITATNNPAFDSTKSVAINGVTYAANTWTVSGTTATQNFSSAPVIAQGDTIVQEYSRLQASDLATVATSGDYDDLTNKPAVPTVVLENATFVGGIGTVTSESRVVTTADVITSGQRSVAYAPWQHASADETSWTDNGSGTLTIEITAGSGDNFWLNTFNDNLNSDVNMFVISWPTAGDTWYYASDMKSQLENMNVNASTQYRTLTYTECEIYPTDGAGDQIKTSDATVTETALGGDLRGGASSFQRFVRGTVTSTTTVQTIVGSRPWDGNRDVTINETTVAVLGKAAGDLFSVSGNTGTRTQVSFSGEEYVDCEAGDVLSQSLGIVFDNNGDSYTLLADAT